MNDDTPAEIQHTFNFVTPTTNLAGCGQFSAPPVLLTLCGALTQLSRILPRTYSSCKEPGLPGLVLLLSIFLVLHFRCPLPARPEVDGRDDCLISSMGSRVSPIQVLRSR